MDNKDTFLILRDIERELKDFRTYGFTSNQLHRSDRFLDVMGCMDNVPYEEVRRRFICILKAILSEDYYEPILVLYGLSPEFKQKYLTERRAAYCKQKNLSVDSFIKRENDMINHLAVLMVEFGPQGLEDIWKKEEARIEQQRVDNLAMRPNSENSSIPLPNIYAPAYDLSNLIGRENILEQLDSKIQTGDLPVYLYSEVGGLGKTEVAKAYCNSKYTKNFDYIFWVSVTSGDVREDIISEPSFKFSGNTDHTRIHERFKKFVIHTKSIQGNVLLVLDNITSLQQLESFDQDDSFSMLRWKVLVTTRAIKDEELFLQHVVQIGELNEIDCEKLFYANYNELDENINENREALFRMFSDLKRHTLLIKLVAITGNNQYSVNDLSSFIHKQGINHEAFQNIINETIISLFDLANISGDEQYILQCFSTLPDRPLPKNILVQWMKNDSNNEERMAGLLRCLNKNGWLSLEKNVADKTISFKCHNLIQIAVQNKFVFKIIDFESYLQNLSAFFHSAKGLNASDNSYYGKFYKSFYKNLNKSFEKIFLFFDCIYSVLVIVKDSKPELYPPYSDETNTAIMNLAMIIYSLRYVRRVDRAKYGIQVKRKDLDALFKKYRDNRYKEAYWK